MKKSETLGYDLIVDDEELNVELERIYQRAVKYEETLKQYVEILKNVVTNSVIEGNVAKNLKFFYIQVLTLQGEIEEIVAMIQRLTLGYESAIDEADSYLYY
ncbi:hypothetical protein [Roseburia sp. 499]|uniref:hypothetical protein n=1 Tax=Roseburia sp. 499 TaxID=1261634 RepID=UPI0009510FFA|nr:hypothetical protein [Roseburia sp. 499]WVK70176.1 hypothetical protein BIV20_01200 [Roseburia sp. 499]